MKTTSLGTGVFFSFTSLGSPFPRNVFFGNNGPSRHFSTLCIHAFMSTRSVSISFILDKTHYFHPIFSPTCQKSPSIINSVNWAHVFFNFSQLSKIFWNWRFISINWEFFFTACAEPSLTTLSLTSCKQMQKSHKESNIHGIQYL